MSMNSIRGSYSLESFVGVCQKIQWPHCSCRTPLHHSSKFGNPVHTLRTTRNACERDLDSTQHTPQEHKRNVLDLSSSGTDANTHSTDSCETVMLLSSLRFSEKNKMEPTNPDANTIEKLHMSKEHSCRTLLWNTLVGHSYGTFL